MSRPRPHKKARVYRVPRDEMVSVTRVSSSSDHQVVTQTVLPVDNSAKTATNPLAPVDEAGPAAKTANPQVKRRYISSVSLFQFLLSEPLFCIFVLPCFCFAHFRVLFYFIFPPPPPSSQLRGILYRMILLPNGCLNVTTSSMSFFDDVVGVALTPTNVPLVCQATVALKVFDVWSAHSPQQCACIA